MKIINKSIIPIQQCSLCKTKVKLKHKDILRDAISLNYAVWRCPLCKDISVVNWEKINESICK